jgi:tripartite-type tricarboxylate transporter receptor subunit TctC
MKLPRRTILQFAGAVAAAPAFSKIVTAQTYPTQPITMIVPFAAGASTDLVGRMLAERMRGTLGQPIIIENVSGAEGNNGTSRAARARPDGYTITIGTVSTHMLNSVFYSLQYDVLNDFAPISPVVTAPIVLYARRTMLAKDLNELFVWLKANPHKASAAIVATNNQVLMALLQKELATQFVLVPYRGGAPAVQDLLTGQIDLAFNPPDQLSLVQAGRIKAYAVTGDKRLAVAPDIPTFVEMGLPQFLFSAWAGVFAPKGTPRDIIGKLNAAVVDAIADPGVQSRFADLGFDVFPRDQQTPEALGALQKAEAAKWWPLIKEFGIKAE